MPSGTARATKRRATTTQSKVFGRWLTGVCERFGVPIDVLDLGCGTGRYFRYVRGARRLVGVDVSTPMLDLARHPVGVVTADSVQLVEADFLQADFDPGRYDLICSNRRACRALALRSRAGRPRANRGSAPAAASPSRPSISRCPSIPRTMARRVAEWALPVAGPFRPSMRSRLLSGGLYADRQRLHDVLVGAGFAIESIESFQSDVHLHLLAVARAAE